MCVSRFTGRFVISCLAFSGFVIGMDFGLFELICWLLIDSVWWCLMVMVRKHWFIAWSFIGFVMNCHWFWLFSNFLSRFLLDCYCRYRPLVSGFAGWLKLIVIKNPCKTWVLWICWNYLWGRCWRLVGKCVIFGFFAADTATKQPKWLFCKCRSTAL